jgi:glycosyltransferase involved in cell wall biosynthesis
MKRILIDLYKAKDPYSGLGQFSLNFAEALREYAEKDVDYYYLLAPGVELEGIELSNQVRAGFWQRYFPFMSHAFHVWHSLQQFPSYLPHRKSKWLLTIHDLNFLIEKKEVKKQKYLKQLQQNIDKADVLTTISHFTKKQIETHLDIGKKEVRVIPNGVKLKVFPDAKRPVWLEEGTFFFSIGIFSKKKNFHFLLPLLKYFPDHRLVIAGNKDTSYGKQLTEMAKEEGVAERLVLPGKIDDSEKYWLYTHCRAFLFPSQAEGFGLPVIEAMRAGAPVFLSGLSALPEVGGDKAFYFSNFEEEHLASVVKSGLSEWDKNPSERESEVKLYSQKFSWGTCIQSYLGLYKEMYK